MTITSIQEGIELRHKSQEKEGGGSPKSRKREVSNPMAKQDFRGTEDPAASQETGMAPKNGRGGSILEEH